MTLTQRLLKPRTPGWADYFNQRMPGETPHPDDRFFYRGQPTSAASGTAVTASGTAVWQEGYSRLSVAATNQSSDDFAAYVWPITSAAAPMTIETRGRLAAKRDDNPMWGVVFSDGTTTGAAIAAVGVYVDDTGSVSLLGRWTGTFTAATTTNIHGDMPESMPLLSPYLRLVWTASNTFAWSLSLDGVTWSDFGATTFSRTITPTHFGVFASSWGQSYTLPVGYDYFRVYNADLSV